MIEECLYGAISDLEGVARLDNYLKLQYKKFMGSTLELLIHDAIEKTPYQKSIFELGIK